MNLYHLLLGRRT